MNLQLLMLAASLTAKRQLLSVNRRYMGNLLGILRSETVDVSAQLNPSRFVPSPAWNRFEPSYPTVHSLITSRDWRSRFPKLACFKLGTRLPTGTISFSDAAVRRTSRNAQRLHRSPTRSAISSSSIAASPASASFVESVPVRNAGSAASRSRRALSSRE